MFMRARQRKHFRKIQCTRVTQQLGRQSAQKSALPCICILLWATLEKVTTTETPHKSQASCNCMPEKCHFYTVMFSCGTTGVVVHFYKHNHYPLSHVYTSGNQHKNQLFHCILCYALPGGGHCMQNCWNTSQVTSKLHAWNMPFVTLFLSSTLMFS